MKQTTIEHLKSAALTFLVGFAVAVTPMLDSLNVQSLETSALVGLVMAGVRAGLKLLLETFVVWYKKA